MPYIKDKNGNWIWVPSGGTGGSSGTDISLGMTGASVGQIARITAVDENGVPTAWEAVEMEEQVILLAETEALAEDAASIEITELELSELGYIFRLTGTNSKVGNGLDVTINGAIHWTYTSPGSSIFISMGKINGVWKLNILTSDIRSRSLAQKVNNSFSGILNSVKLAPHYASDTNYLVAGSKLMIYKGLSDALFIAD